uniref:hypothetical protein n=1 Tax=Paractinoplanes polyasparticus TaxID=2856853 RepID=UPI001C85D570|nr:hypothetical protein [Actinoplanes polyasparticus]
MESASRETPYLAADKSSASGGGPGDGLAEGDGEAARPLPAHRLQAIRWELLRGRPMEAEIRLILTAAAPKMNANEPISSAH